ncbi:DUF5330 domain-containing protein [Pseudovibrio exalbescens]|uniref:DUF5330 domain-containing protein n=1 Tax=Pseudovibrio exalbescens TaxID=197461 RepID=UPI0023651C46|nr:DUF5330 domain-containing protein [Pseudovibrio exalbescens]MDD7909163.1 DUF5330 domain-containing protein [Pseudovibrio exalbescens]
MFSLLRKVFWLSLLLLLLPIGLGSNEDAPSIGFVQAINAAQTTFSDLSGFCDRNPDTCETGSSVVTLVGLKAKQAARLAYQYLNEDDVEALDGALSGDENTILSENAPSLDSELVVNTPDSGQPDTAQSGTLTSEDLEIPWRLAKAAVEAGALDELKQNAQERAGALLADPIDIEGSGVTTTGSVETAIPLPRSKPTN